MNLITTLFSNALFVSLLILLLVSIVGIYVNARARDRCLRDFHEYVVTTLEQEGMVKWGRLRVYSSGIELLYLEEEKEEEHVENSYILHQKDLEGIQVIYRFLDHQSPADRRRREQEIERAYRPSLWRRMVRGVRNTLSTFKDALVQTLGAFLGYRAKLNPQSPLLVQYQQLTQSSAQVLGGMAGNAYEPILEQYIGHYVVLEIAEGDRVEQEYGILKEYSARYIELLNTKLEVPLHIYLRIAERDVLDLVRVERAGERLVVTNTLDHAVHVDALRCDGQRRAFDLALPPGTQEAIPLGEDALCADAVPEFSVHCLADLIVPRTHGVVRHAGRRDKLPLRLVLGLEHLPRLPWMRRLDGSQPWSRQDRPPIRDPRSGVRRG